MARRKKPLVDKPEPIQKAKPTKKKPKKKATRRIHQPVKEKVDIILQVLNELDQERKREITLEVIELFLETCASGLSTTNAALCCQLNKGATEKLISLIPNFEGEVQRRRTSRARLVTTAMYDKAKAGDVAAAKLYLSWHRQALPELQQITQIEVGANDNFIQDLAEQLRVAGQSVPVEQKGSRKRPVGDGSGGVNRLAELETVSSN